MPKSEAVLAALCLLCFMAAAAAGPAGCGTSAAARERAAAEAFLAGREAPVYGFRVVATYPHDSGDFTEGLVLADGALYEGTGLHGRSRLKKSALETGCVQVERELAPEHFGEGVTVLGGEVFQLTYTSQMGFVYDRQALSQRRTFTYRGEGWGLTHDGADLIMSDGTSTLYFMDPATFAEKGRVTVADNLGPVTSLNELEYVDGVVYANVWKTSVIAMISPSTGEVTGWLNLAGLDPDPADLTGESDLNGIAWDGGRGNLLVTGKCWPHIYAIDLLDQP